MGGCERRSYVDYNLADLCSEGSISQGCSRFRNGVLQQLDTPGYCSVGSRLVSVVQRRVDPLYDLGSTAQYGEGSSAVDRRDLRAVNHHGRYAMICEILLRLS